MSHYLNRFEEISADFKPEWGSPTVIGEFLQGIEHDDSDDERQKEKAIDHRGHFKRRK